MLIRLCLWYREMWVWYLPRVIWRKWVMKLPNIRYVHWCFNMVAVSLWVCEYYSNIFIIFSTSSCMIIIPCTTTKLMCVASVIYLHTCLCFISLYRKQMAPPPMIFCTLVWLYNNLIRKMFQVESSSNFFFMLGIFRCYLTIGSWKVEKVNFSTYRIWFQ